MDEKSFLDRCHKTLSHIEAALEQAVVQSGVLEIECADGSKVIVSPHLIAREIWVAAKSGGFHFRHDDTQGWVDTRTGAPLSNRLSEILKQQGQLQVNLA